MDIAREGWFSEVGEMWPGEAKSLKVDEILFQEKSKYQDIMVFRNEVYGNVLVLDGVIQCTEKDEHAYQEMIVHLPVNSHPRPEKVLVIGGGDGGVVRELTKHPAVKEVTMCEIDKKVVEVSKKYLPYMSSGFDSPKLTLHFGDGFDFMGKHEGEFDVIITDSSDPVGPAETLFRKSYYELMKKALRPGGLICTQGESIWLHLDLVEEIQTFSKELYSVVDYAYTLIPTYPSGMIGFMLCSTDPDTCFRKPHRVLSEEEMLAMNLRYYSPEIHVASFVLPRFATKRLQKK